MPRTARGWWYRQALAGGTLAIVLALGVAALRPPAAPRPVPADRAASAPAAAVRGALRLITGVMPLRASRSGDGARTVVPTMGIRN